MAFCAARISLAFLYGWARMTVIVAGSIAVFAYLFGDYMSRVIPLGAHSSPLWAGIIVIVLTVVNYLGIREGKAWAGLATVGLCYRERTVKGETTTEVCYFIGSRRMAARRYAAALRNHWGIENKLHWQLDVSFNEDKNRVSKRHGAENLALVRRLALGLLKQHPDKRSLACKRLLAGLDPAFVEEVLRGDSNLGKL